MNYGEEYAYWYLRLNGFFPISNFVIHRSNKVRYSSDCDVLAIRLPHVYEEIGGKPDDWDTELKEMVDFGSILGIICSVKTGKYDSSILFEDNHVEYAISRLGLQPHDQSESLAYQLRDKPLLGLDGNLQIAKLLIAENGEATDRYLFRSLESVKSFLFGRVEQYPKEKHQDRMFFGSIQFQTIIDLASSSSRATGIGA